MKFFHARRIQTHIHMKAPKRNAKGDRKVVILFRVALNGDSVRSAPDVVKWAYDGVKTKGEDHVGIKHEVENINMEAFRLPEAKRASIRFAALYLTNLTVKEIKSGKGDTSIVLTFQCEYDWDTVVWEWLGENYSTDVFLEFDAAQASLLDIQDKPEGEDVDDDKQVNIGDFKDKEEKAASGKEAASGE